jgi:hypothetical protein
MQVLAWATTSPGNNCTIDEDYTEEATGSTFTENWSTYANGDDWTEVDAAYTRTSTNVTVDITTETDAPAGLSAFWSSANGNHYGAYRDDIGTALAARTTERVQFLILFKLTAVTTVRGGFGYSISDEVHTGALVQCFGTNTHYM